MDDISQQLLFSLGAGIVLSLFLIIGSSYYSTFHTNKSYAPTNVRSVAFFPHDDNDNDTQQKLERRVRKIQKILGRTQEEVKNKLGLDSRAQRTRSKDKANKLLGVSDNELEVAKEQNEQLRRQQAYVAKKGKKLTKVLGIDETEIIHAMQTANPMVGMTGVMNQSGTSTGRDVLLDEPVNWYKMVDAIVLFVLVGVLIYFLQLSTHGNFGRVLCGLFPREFETLGLKERLERI